MTHRVQRVQELIRRELGPILDKNFHFPGCIATIHEVSLTPDLKQCFVYVGILGKTEEPGTIVKRLNDGRSLVQRELYKRVKLKNSPTVFFKYDDSVERGVRIVNLIEKLPEPLPDEPALEGVQDNFEEEEEERIRREGEKQTPLDAARMNDSLATIVGALRDARRVGLACHVRPDGDAIGSLVGLARSLKLEGKEVHALSEDGVPANLAFLPDCGIVERPRGEAIDLDVAVALDTATKDRLGERTNQSFSTAPLLVNVDHHGTNPRYGHLNHIDTDQPATGQIVYELLTQGGFPVDDAVRQNLFAAISTDTGSFQFSSTTPRTHRIIAEMMEAGLDTARLSQRLYHEHPHRRMQLLKALLNEMKLTCDNRVASWALTAATQQAVSMEAGDTEGLIDTLRSIEGTMAVVMFEEIAEGKVRVSARSKDERLDVSKVCAEFGGGGHKMAAGARLRGPLAEAQSHFLDSLKNEIERLR